MATTPRSSRPSFGLEGLSEPRSGLGQLTPEMLDAMRKFMEVGGYEGMKKRIVEEGEPTPFPASPFPQVANKRQSASSSKMATRTGTRWAALPAHLLLHLHSRDTPRL